MWRLIEGTDGHGEVSRGETVPQIGAESDSQSEGVCEGGEHRVLALIGEAPGSMRGLIGQTLSYVGLVEGA